MAPDSSLAAPDSSQWLLESEAGSLSVTPKVAMCEHGEFLTVASHANGTHVMYPFSYTDNSCGVSPVE